MRKNNLIALAFTLPLTAAAAPPTPLASVAAVASAASTVATSPAVTAAAPLQLPTATTQSDRLKSMYARIPELRAQADIAELEARIRTANAVNSSGSSAGLSAPLPNASPTNKMPSSVLPTRFSSSTIDVVSIRAYNHEYSAILQIDGSVVPVVVGDLISDGWKVSAITARQVELTRKGHPPRILRIM